MQQVAARHWAGQGGELFQMLTSDYRVLPPFPQGCNGTAWCVLLGQGGERDGGLRDGRERKRPTYYLRLFLVLLGSPSDLVSAGLELGGCAIMYL